MGIAAVCGPRFWQRLGHLIAVIVVLSGCSATPALPSATRSTQPAADAARFASATCTAMDELFLAFGNPDTNEKSVAWKSLEAALEASNAAKADAAAIEILGHLGAARAATAQGAAWQPGSDANAQLDASLAALETAVKSVRGTTADRADKARFETKVKAAWPPMLAYFQKLQPLLRSGQLPISSLQCAGEPVPSGPG